MERLKRLQERKELLELQKREHTVSTQIDCVMFSRVHILNSYFKRNFSLGERPSEVLMLGLETVLTVGWRVKELLLLIQLMKDCDPCWYFTCVKRVSESERFAGNH